MHVENDNGDDVTHLYADLEQKTITIESNIHI